MFRRRAEGGNHLDNLQRDSWQLELIVTGFALAAMISGESAFSDWANGIGITDDGRSVSKTIVGAGVTILTAAYYIILCNFFINVVVRCLWIAAVGLRSVNNNVRYEHVRLAPLFRNFLRRRHGNFDGYVRRLDDFSSLIFALTFLMIAIVMSIFAIILFAVVVVGVTSLLLDLRGSPPTAMIVLIFLYAVFAILYMLDFLTLGFFKRFRLLSYVYYPIYRFYGWLTLARLYRPFYYNLVTNRRTRYVPPLVLLYLLTFLVLSSMRLTPVQYLQRDGELYGYNNAGIYHYANYADQDNIDPDGAILILPSEIITDRTLKVRIPVRPNWDRYIASNCPELKEVNSYDVTSLFIQGFLEGFNDPVAIEGGTYDSAYVACLRSPARLYLDDERLSLDEALFNPRGEGQLTYAEFVAFVALDSLSRGLHTVSLHRQSERLSDTVPAPDYKALYTVPFYYEPER